jgi:tetratricopeptide (TPR) repeat protein
MFNKSQYVERIGFFLLCLFIQPCFADNNIQIDQNSVNDSYELEFEQAMMLVQQGNYDEANKLFYHLNEETHSPRVKIEWANLLYIAGDKDKSKKLFKEVLDLNPPMLVRERIKQYLDDIALTEGKIDFSFGLVRDTNPKFVSRETAISIWGQTFDYNSGVTNKPQYGKNYLINYSKGLDDQNRWIASFLANGTKFSDVNFDRTGVEESLTFVASKVPKVDVKVAYEQYFFSGKLLFTQPSASLKFFYVFNNASNISTEIRASKSFYDNYDYLNGPMYSIQGSYNYPIYENIFLGLELGFDRMKANDSVYAFRNDNWGVISSFFIPAIFTKGQIRYSEANRYYDSQDQLFELARDDYRRGLYFSMVYTNLNLFGLEAALDLSKEKNISNINIYSYERELVGLNLRKTF